MKPRRNYTYHFSRLFLRQLPSEFKPLRLILAFSVFMLSKSIVNNNIKVKPWEAGFLAGCKDKYDNSYLCQEQLAALNMSDITSQRINPPSALEPQTYLAISLIMLTLLAIATSIKAHLINCSQNNNLEPIFSHEESNEITPANNS